MSEALQTPMGRTEAGRFRKRVLKQLARQGVPGATRNRIHEAMVRHEARRRRLWHEATHGSSTS